MFSLPCYAGEDEKPNLNLHIASSPILPPILNSYASDDYMSLYANEPSPAIQSKGHYALGLVRFKADKTMRIRGWEIGQNHFTRKSLNVSHKRKLPDHFDFPIIG